MFQIVNSNYERFQVFGFIEDKLYEALEGSLNASYENGFFVFIIIYDKECFPFKNISKILFSNSNISS